eukprot:NODE_2593_length_503_cov_105.561674_g2059_i0.p1 GENE.NODE_2593_length_503_cov_105.561674_g2059_i0~~NODE_2593_length_503_cov_105.561674_g2059_i0.p1  ORF type:complete len:135 (+),score=18.03 NODE_2593_length_503_cov_105.561674_g2059_i0:57-407(+)
MFLLIVAVFFLASSEAAPESLCSANTNCNSCLAQEKLGFKICSWCYKDASCHDVGSVYDFCSDEQCTSRARPSRCEIHNCTACLYPTCNDVHCKGRVVPVREKCLCLDNGNQPCPK